MNPIDHVAADAAIRAKKARAAGQPLHGGSAPSPTSRMAAIAIWVLAIGSLAALVLFR